MTARILVVDDILPNRKLLEAKLTAEYFDVLLASDGPTAIAIAKEQLPDLILLDVMMPGLDGFSLCEILKTRDDTNDIPIIMVTAKTTVGDVEKAFAVKADDFVAKPFEWQELFGKINRCLAMSSAN